MESVCDSVFVGASQSPPIMLLGQLSVNLHPPQLTSDDNPGTKHQLMPYPSSKLDERDVRDDAKVGAHCAIERERSKRGLH